MKPDGYGYPKMNGGAYECAKSTLLNYENCYMIINVVLYGAFSSSFIRFSHMDIRHARGFYSCSCCCS